MPGGVAILPGSHWCHAFHNQPPTPRADTWLRGHGASQPSVWGRPPSPPAARDHWRSKAAHGEGGRPWTAAPEKGCVTGGGETAEGQAWSRSGLGVRKCKGKERGCKGWGPALGALQLRFCSLEAQRGTPVISLSPETAAKGSQVQGQPQLLSKPLSQIVKKTGKPLRSPAPLGLIPSTNK